MIDTAQKRQIALRVPFAVTPLPSGTVDATERAALVGVYLETGVTPDIVGILSVSFEAFAPDITFVGRSA